MNISRVALCALLSVALPAFAQPDVKPGVELPYPKVTPEDAAKLGLTDKPIKLHLRDVTFYEALDQLQLQSGLQLNEISTFVGPSAEKKLSLDLETRSLTQAFDAVIKAAGISAYLYRRDSFNRLAYSYFEDADSKDALLSGQGAFQLRVTSLSSSSHKTTTVSKTAAPNKTQDSALTVGLSFIVEPQLPVMCWSSIRLLRADDDKGHSLLPEENGATTNNDFDTILQTKIALLLPQADAQKIAHLEGTVTYILPTKHETWEVPDVFAAKKVAREFQSGGQTIRIQIQDIRKTDSGLSLKLRVNLPTVNAGHTLPNPFISFEQVAEAIRLTDAKGRILQTRGGNGGSNSSEANIEETFALPPSQTPPTIGMDGKPMDAETPTLQGPIKLTFNVPTEFVQTQVPFSFHDLPLP